MRITVRLWAALLVFLAVSPMTAAEETDARSEVLSPSPTLSDRPVPVTDPAAEEAAQCAETQRAYDERIKAKVLPGLHKQTVAVALLTAWANKTAFALQFQNEQRRSRAQAEHQEAFSRCVREAHLVEVPDAECVAIVTNQCPESSAPGGQWCRTFVAMRRTAPKFVAWIQGGFDAEYCRENLATAMHFPKSVPVCDLFLAEGDCNDGRFDPILSELERLAETPEVCSPDDRSFECTMSRILTSKNRLLACTEESSWGDMISSPRFCFDLMRVGTDSPAKPLNPYVLVCELLRSVKEDAPGKNLNLHMSFLRDIILSLTQNKPINCNSHFHDTMNLLCHSLTSKTAIDCPKTKTISKQADISQCLQPYIEESTIKTKTGISTKITLFNNTHIDCFCSIDAVFYNGRQSYKTKIKDIRLLPGEKETRELSSIIPLSDKSEINVSCDYEEIIDILHDDIGITDI